MLKEESPTNVSEMLILLFWALPLVSAAEPIVLDLTQVVQRVEQQNFELAQRRQAVEAAQAQFYERFSLISPDIRLSLDMRRQKDASAGGRARFGGESFSLYSFDIEATMPILNRGTLPAFREVRLLQQRRQKELEQELRDLRYRALFAFYENLYAQKRLDLLMRTKKVFQESLRFSRQRQRIGQSRRLDVLQIEAQLALMEPKIEQAQTDFENSSIALSELMVSEADQAFRLENNFKIPPFSEVTGLDLDADQKRLELKVAELERQEFEQSRILDLSSHWPSLEAFGNFGRSGSTSGDLFDSDFDAWAVGLRLEVPIFNGFQYWNKRRRLDSELAQSRTNESRLANQYYHDRQRKLNNLNTVYTVQTAYDRAVDLVKKSLDEARKEYRLAGIDYFQLLNAEQEFLDTELQSLENQRGIIQSILDYAVAYSVPSGQLIALLVGKH